MNGQHPSVQGLELKDGAYFPPQLLLFFLPLAEGGQLLDAPLQPRPLLPGGVEELLELYPGEHAQCFVPVQTLSHLFVGLQLAQGGV